MIRALLVLALAVLVGRYVDPLGSGWERLAFLLAVVVGFVALICLLHGPRRDST